MSTDLSLVPTVNPFGITTPGIGGGAGAGAGASADPTRASLLSGITGTAPLVRRKTIAELAREAGTTEEIFKKVLDTQRGGVRSTEAEMNAFKTITGKFGIAPEIRP